ncbi:MAG: hypothetical protein FJ207_15655, partial [Gemmatimonadetes bacterium]|nr:hypothetical protein [Gemmatimonadota bacterium]
MEVLSRAEVGRKHLEAEPEPIERTCGPLAAPLGRLLAAMVAKEPRERPTMKEVVDGLRFELQRLREHFPPEAEVHDDEVGDDELPVAAS